MNNFLKSVVPMVSIAALLTACGYSQTDLHLPVQTPNSESHVTDSNAKLAEGEELIQHDDFTGEWYRTNTVKAFSGTVTIENQTDKTFDFSFFGAYGANSGEIHGTAVFTSESTAQFTHTPEYDKTMSATVEFVMDEENLQIRLVDGDVLALGFGHNVNMDGEYTKADPVYTDASVLDEILPTHEIKAKMHSLLGDDVYEQFVFVIENGIRYEVEHLTYSGFVSGAGMGVDLYIDKDKIYCLAYGLDLDGSVYKLYTNDEAHQDKLPPFMKIERPDYKLQFVYKQV